jgi:hypothetical protein
MAIRLLKLDQPLILPLPDLVLVGALVQDVGAMSFPSEPDFVQQCLSIKSHFVIDIIGPLPIHPRP